jgi:hypothetical protein
MASRVPCRPNACAVGLPLMLAIAALPASGIAQSVIMPVIPGGGGFAAGEGQASIVATLGEPIMGTTDETSQAEIHTGFLAGLTTATMSGAIPTVVATAGQPVTVTVTLEGFHEEPVVSLHCRMGGAPDFSTVPMTRAVGDERTWSGVIPAALVGVRGILFYIEADDGFNSLKLPDGSPTVLNSIQVTLADQPLFATNDRYAMRGVGMVADNPEASQVFRVFGPYDIADWRYATYDPATQAYVEPPQAASAVPGRGFWIISRTTRDISASGHSTRIDRPFAVTLRHGWNLIANPFAFTVAFADLSLPAGTDGNLIGWDGGGYANYRQTLEPGLGYWLYYDRTAPASLLIPPVGPSAKDFHFEMPLPSLADDEFGWRVLVSAEAGACTDTDNRFGLAAGASAARDPFDFMAAPPPPANYVALSFLGDRGARLLNDFRSTDSEGERWMLSLDTDRVHERFRVRFDVERALPPDWRLSAINASNLQEIDLVATGEIVGRTGPLGANHRWHLAAGPAAFLDRVRNDAQEELSQSIVAFALHPSYPNPFMACTGSVITLAAPRQERATVRVYDLRGRLIATLHDGLVDRGLTRLNWHGEDDSNQRVAAGVYLVRLRAAETEIVQRILLVH